MRKIALILLAFCLFACQRDGLTIKNGVLTVGVEANYPPMEYLTPYGEFIGFDIDLARALGKKLDLEVRFVNTKWNSIFTELSMRRFDVIISSVSILPERELSYAFSKPYLENSLSLIVNKNADIKPTTLKELVGLRIAYQAETSTDHLLHQWARDNDVQLDCNPHFRVDSCLGALQNGQVDVVIIDGIVAYEYLRYLNFDDRFEMSGVIFNEDLLGVCMLQDNPELLELVNSALKELKTEGILEQLSYKYFNQNLIRDCLTH